MTTLREAAEMALEALESLEVRCTDSETVTAWYPEVTNKLREALAQPEREPLTDEEIDQLSRTMVKGGKSVNWLCQAIERAHGVGG